MKYLFLICITIFATQSFALGLEQVQNAVGTPKAINTGSGTVTATGWTELAAAAAVTTACSAILISNNGSQALRLGKGALASEIDTGVVIPPGGVVLVPETIQKGVRLSVRSMGDPQSSGWVTLSCYQ